MNSMEIMAAPNRFSNKSRTHTTTKNSNTVNEIECSHDTVDIGQWSMLDEK